MVTTDSTFYLPNFTIDDYNTIPFNTCLVVTYINRSLTDATQFLFSIDRLCTVLSRSTLLGIPVIHLYITDDRCTQYHTSDGTRKE